jgi:hypothetical protein
MYQRLKGENLQCLARKPQSDRTHLLLLEFSDCHRPHDWLQSYIVPLSSLPDRLFHRQLGWISFTSLHCDRGDSKVQTETHSTS